MTAVVLPAWFTVCVSVDDVLPAKSLGLATVLVRRRGFGATRRAEGAPDLEVGDLQMLASLAVA